MDLQVFTPIFYQMVLGSTTLPEIATAAAVLGLASIVLAPGPWRPSKFRFDVETASFPSGILSSFMARQARDGVKAQLVQYD